MTLKTMLEELAARTPAPTEATEASQKPARPRCLRCYTSEVQEHGENCQACTVELNQGYEILRKTGRRANGSQLDAGALNHAVLIGEIRALCGTKPGRRADWSMYHEKIVTCERCKTKLEKRKK